MTPQQDRRSAIIYSIVAIAMSHAVAVLSEHTLYITPQDPVTNSTPCLTCYKWSTYVSKNASISSHTTYVFYPGRHIHKIDVGDGTLTMSDLDNITFIGFAGTENVARSLQVYTSTYVTSPSIIECQVGSSFAFYKIRNLSIINMTFVNCGSPTKSAVLMMDLVGLRVEGVSIQNSTRDGLNCSGVGENSKIVSSSFVGNNQLALDIGTEAAVEITRSALVITDSAFVNNHATGISFSVSNISMNGSQMFINNGDGAMNISESKLSASHINLIVAHNHVGISATSSTISVESGKVLFRGNTAHFGAALCLRTASVVIVNTSATFVGNNAHSGGAIYAILSNISFLLSNFECDSNHAEYTGGCMYLLSSQMSFENVNNGLFSRNVAWDSGGAMYIDIRSTLNIVAPVSLRFERNSAVQCGGAIYVNDDIASLLLPPNPCFFTYTDANGNHNQQPNASMDFILNEARSGTVIYGGNIDTCVLFISPSKSTVKFDTLFHFIENSSVIEISSPPFQICSCPIDHTMCTPLAGVKKTLYPGQPLVVEFYATGQRFGASPAIVVPRVSTKDRPSEFLAPFLADSKCQNHTITYFSNTPQVTLLTQSAYSAQASNNFGVKINIIFLDCPAGFVLHGANGSSAVCVCDPLILKQVEYCSIANLTIAKSSKYTWFGKGSSNSSTMHYTEYCFPSFCSDELTYSPLSPDNQCINGHTGLMCSHCPENSSLTLGIPECRECNNNSLLLLLVFSGAGILLVAALFLFNLTITTGTINGILWYSFVIHENYNCFFPKHFSHKTKFLFIFAAWLNLDVGIVTCFYDGLDNFQSALLQLAFPLYLFVIFLLIIICNMRSTRISKLCRSNAVPVLATLAYMSLSKLIRMSIAALYPVKIYATGETYRWVWLYDGSLDYFQGKHIAIATSGLVVLLAFILPYGSLLIFAPWLQSYSHRWGLRWVNRLKPFLDNYQAPYKEQFRYWTGAMFIFRIILTIISHVSANKPSFILVMIIVVHVSIMLVAGVTVYRNWRLSVLESFFHINMVVLATIRLLDINNNSYAVWICVGSALICFVGIVIYHAIAYIIYPHCHCCRATLNIRNAPNDGNYENTVHLRESLLEHSF